MRKNLLIVIAFTFGFQSYAGGGWVHNKYKGYFKVAQNVIRSPHLFDSDGNIVDIPTVSLYTTSVYGEYGLSDNLTAVVYMPFFVRSTLNKVEFRQSGNTIEGDAINSFGDTNIGFKYGFFQDRPVVMAASLMLGLPLGSSEVSSERILQTGDGEFNQLVKIEASHSFAELPFYASLLVGFNNRTNGFSDEFHWGGEVGFTSERLVAILKVYSIESFYNGDSAGNSQSNGVFANNTEYFSYTPELAYIINESWGLSAAAGFAFSGRQILAAPNYSVGVFFSL
ncbi:MAG: hypothetical protein ABJG41_14640 [Cyclobacteriaceae bacterium]